MGDHTTLVTVGAEGRVVVPKSLILTATLVALILTATMVLFVGLASAPRAAAQTDLEGDCSQDAATLAAVGAATNGSIDVVCVNGFAVEVRLNAEGVDEPEFPVEVTNLTKLTHLSASYGNFSSLPPEIGNLTALESLVIAYSTLESLPAEIGKLVELTEVDLSWNRLRELPPEIGNLAGLTDLDLTGNQLGLLPPEMGNLAALTELDVSQNELGALVPQIGNLARLTRLDVADNDLESLPSEFADLTTLTELRLAANSFSALPPEIGNLRALIYLDLSENQLNAIAPEIGNLGALTTLYVQGNGLSTLPAEFATLTQLSSLDLSNNQFSTWPAVIGDLGALSSLTVNDNRNLLTIPADIAKLANLQYLNARSIGARSLPASIGALAELQSLDVSNNKISVLPRTIGDLSNLKRLVVAETLLTALPAEVGGLTQLQVLDINETFIGELPAEITLTALNAFTAADTPLEQSLPYAAVRSCATESPELVVVTAGGSTTKPAITVDGVSIDPDQVRAMSPTMWAVRAPDAGSGPTYELTIDGTTTTVACAGYQEELTIASSCLASDGRIDVMFVNQDSASRYRIEFPGLTARERTVAPSEAWRMPFTGRPDGTYAIAVIKTRLEDNAVTRFTRTVVVDCDDGASPGPQGLSDEVQILSYCVAGNGFVRYQFVNPTADDRTYVVKFEGLPNRSTTAKGFGASISGVSGRPDGSYITSVEYGDQRNVPIYSSVVTIDCDA